MLLSTEGLPGPVTVKRFGKPAIVSPSAERGPSAHFSRSERPSRPRRSIAEQRARHRVEAGAEHDRVERELLVADAQAALRDLVDRRLADRDEPHVGAVVRLEVVGVDAHALRARADGRRGTAARRPRDRATRSRILSRMNSHTQLVGRRDRRTGRSRPSAGRSRRRRSAPRTRARAPRASRPTRSARARSTGCRPSSCAPRGGTRRSAPCDRAIASARERRVPGRHAEVGGALEHRQLRGLLGDDRDRLHGGGARADHAHALAGEVDALVRPEAGVVQLAREALEARGCRGRAAPRGSPWP